MYLAGCTTVTLPLCPRLAEWSYPSGGGRGKTVNYFVDVNANRRGINIEPLSNFVANFTGSTWSAKWLKVNYKNMICAFDPRQMTGPANASDNYLSCMGHADNWIAITASGNAHDLMLADTKFSDNCAALQP